MKKIIISSILILSFTNIFAQWEFRYFVVRTGATHHLFSKQPAQNNNFFLNTSDGHMRLAPDTASFFIDYVPGINFDLHFHFDFNNDKGGIVVGAEYTNIGISARYKSIYGDYSLTQTHRVNTVGVPVYVKFGNEIFDQQKYFFAGAKYNLNLSATVTDKVNWTSKTTTQAVNENALIENNLSFFVGFNFMFANIQLEYMPESFLNPEYSITKGTQKIKPYSTQPQNLFFVRTSITVPLSEWTTNKSYFLSRLLRRLR